MKRQLRSKRVQSPGTVRQRVERITRLSKPPRPKPTPSGDK